MSTFKPVVQAKSVVTLASTTLTTLAYSVSDVVSTIANNPYDVIVEVSVTTTAISPTLYTQVIVFAVLSLDWDGTTGTFTGASTAVSLANESAWQFVGTLSAQTASTTYIKDFSILQAFGFIPPAFKLILKNDSGQTLGTGAYVINKAEVFATSVI